MTQHQLFNADESLRVEVTFDDEKKSVHVWIKAENRGTTLAVNTQHQNFSCTLQANLTSPESQQPVELVPDDCTCYSITGDNFSCPAHGGY